MIEVQRVPAVRTPMQSRPCNCTIMLYEIRFPFRMMI